MKLRAAIAALLLAAAPASADPGGAGAERPASAVRRFVVIAGNNVGGEGTRPLRFAEQDARRVHDSLLRLGGVEPRDVRLLLGGSAEQLAEALSFADRGAIAAKARGQSSELLLYYSGHAKDGELRLGESRFPLEALRARLTAAGADVRIALLDACRSGAITRTKGARRAPAFELGRGPAEARGLVILTSSSDDEESQESDDLQGSFFTHALVSGMLGEADASRDGRVTLAEAYAFAYDRTVEGTVGTLAGIQHPTFHFDLAGQGDVVLTRVGEAESWLELGEALQGTFLVVSDEGEVAAEARKGPGASERLAVAPGAFTVKSRRGERLALAEVTIPARGGVRLEPASFRDAPLSADPVKGAWAAWAPEPRIGVTAGLGLQTFLSAPARELWFPTLGLVGLELELRDHLREGWILGADLALGQTSGTLAIDGRDFDYELSQAKLGLSLATEFRRAHALRPVVGVRIGLLSMERRFPDEPRLAPQGLLTTAPGLQAGLSWAATEQFALTSRARLSWLVYEADEDHSLAFLDLTAGARLEF